MKLRLTQRDIDILRNNARLQLLSTAQHHQLHFRESSPQSAANRLRQLKSAGFIKNVYAPLTSEQTQNPTRPSSIWFFPPDCARKVEEQLLAQHRASEWQLIEDEISTFNKSQKFAQQSLVHETGISDIFIADEQQLPENRDFEISFRVRTSPRFEGVSKKILVTRAKRGVIKPGSSQTVTLNQTVNPDYFSGYRRNQSQHSFVYGEFDNDSSNIVKFFEKMEGYAAYLKQGHFREVAALFSDRYRLGISEPDKASFRVCTVVDSKTNAKARMNALYEACLRLPGETFFNFTTLEQYKADPYGPIWYNKATFRTVGDEYGQRIQKATPHIRRKRFAETVPNLQAHALLG